MIAVGARDTRTSRLIGFPADDAAKRHGASVPEDTMDPGVAYGPVPRREPTAIATAGFPSSARTRERGNEN